MSNFRLLQKLLDNALEVEIDENMSPIYKRFFLSYQNGFEDRSLLDIAILLRQILLTQKNNATLFVPNNNEYPSLTEWNQVGIVAKRNGDKWEIYANFWTPHWLKGSETQAVDAAVIKNEDRRFIINTPSDASDIFLTQCGTQYIKYKSIDQQKAVRATLSLKAGKTLAISLPTGEGKSLIFKLINSVGFYDTKHDSLTLVIVPTVTLALDQEKSMQLEKNNQSVYAFVGGREMENSILKENIKQGKQDICFVSPESLFGSLRQPLLESSENGTIRAIVIDEAHIVEEWGIDFRHEFQLFSGFWRELLETSPSTNRFRTILLSATYTQESIHLLKTLFSLDDSFELYLATKLRPEIDYWKSPILKGEEEREKRVLESILHLPRPLILYVTEVAEAKRFYTLFQKKGFKNLAMVHGQTNSTERDRVVNLWREGNLDIVVATSAFGLGIDYPHTRCVVHACMPETLNRFYQEVGRGGRDGKTSLSLIVPTYKDIEIAKSMNSQKLIGDELGFKRWKRIFQKKSFIEGREDEYTIDLNSASSIDYDGKRNIGWNAQTLLLMVQAQLIELIGFPSTIITDDKKEWQKYLNQINIRILEENHLDEKVWSEAITNVRQGIKESNKKSFKLLQQYLNGNDCPADVLNQIYQLSFDDKEYEVSLLCGSCGLCRGEERTAQYTQSPLGRAYPIQREIEKNLLKFFSTSSVMIEFEKDNFNVRGFERKFVKVIKNLVNKQIQNFIFIGKSKEFFISQKTLDKVSFLPIFIEELKSLQELIVKKKRLPPQTNLIFIGEEVKIDKRIVNVLKEKNSMVFLKKNSVDPLTPNRLLKEVYQYEILQLDELIRRIGK